MAKKKKVQPKPKAPKFNPEAGRPRPAPISLVGPKRIIENARSYPLLGCWIMQGWKESGLAPVIVARKQDENQVLFGSFLVDLYCLGVKDAFCNANFTMKHFQNSLPTLCKSDPEQIDPALAHEIIYGSIAFAAQFGFQPHPDFKLASNLLEPEGTYPRKGKVVFGRKGKPFFIAGPNDNAERIINQLEETAGKGNFDFLFGIGDT